MTSAFRVSRSRTVTPAPLPVARRHGRHDMAVTPAAPSALQQLSIGSTSDPAEREADRMAAAALAGARVTAAVPATAATTVVRRQPPAAPPAPLDPVAALKKADEADAKAKQAEALEALFEQLSEEEPLKTIISRGKEVWATPEGKVAIGSVVAAVVTAFVLAKEELPKTSVDLDLGKATSKLTGAKVQLTWKGPSHDPTEAGAAVTYAPPGGILSGTSLTVGGKTGSETKPTVDLGVGLKTAKGPLGPMDFKLTASLDTQGNAGVTFGLSIPLEKVDKSRKRLEGSRPGAGDARRVDSAFDPSIRRSPAPGTTEAQGAVPPSVPAALASHGAPLAAEVRAPMERSFGADFSAVRIHADAGAAASATAVGALAYTLGPHVVLGPGRWPPTTAANRLTLAHELAHVVQQGAAPPAAEAQR